MLRVVNNHQYSDDLAPLIAHLHHFQRVWLGCQLFVCSLPRPQVSLLRAPLVNSRRFFKMPKPYSNKQWWWCRCSLCSIQQVIVAHGFASHAPFQPKPTHFLAELYSLMSADVPPKHTWWSVQCPPCSRSTAPSQLESLWLCRWKPVNAQTGTTIHC